MKYLQKLAFMNIVIKSKSVCYAKHNIYGEVAIKWANDAISKSILYKEALFLKKYQINNKYRFIKFWVYSTYYLLLITWVQGRCLQDIILAPQTQQKSFYPNWFIDVISTLKLLHVNKVNHGDIHPSNIIIHHSSAVLIDYGACCIHGTCYGHMPFYSYSKNYAAYEPLTQTGIVSPKHDWYSLAITILESVNQHTYQKMDIIEAFTNHIDLNYQANIPSQFMMIIHNEWIKYRKLINCNI